MPNTVVRFGEFELDPRKYELRRSGQPVKLERIPKELLILLVASRGTLVTRETIIAHLWGRDVYGETERGINTAINKLRTVLRDNPRQPRFLQTEIGKGYRFIAEVVEVEEYKAPAAIVPPTTTPSEKFAQPTPPDLTATATAPPISESTEPPPDPDDRIRFRAPGRLDAITHSWKQRIAVGSVILAVVAGVFL